MLAGYRHIVHPPPSALLTLPHFSHISGQVWRPRLELLLYNNEVGSWQSYFRSKKTHKQQYHGTSRAELLACHPRFADEWFPLWFPISHDTPMQDIAGALPQRWVRHLRALEALQELSPSGVMPCRN